MSEINVGAISEQLNNKADLDLNNLPSNYDYVVESQHPTEANGYTWYRLYKSGWLEQGGRYTKTGTSGTITFHKVFKDTGYTFTANEFETTTSDVEGIDLAILVSNLSTSSIRFSKANARFIMWRAEGIAA